MDVFAALLDILLSYALVSLQQDVSGQDTPQRATSPDPSAADPSRGQLSLHLSVWKLDSSGLANGWLGCDLANCLPKRTYFLHGEQTKLNEFQASWFLNSYVWLRKHPEKKNSQDKTLHHASSPNHSQTSPGRKIGFVSASARLQMWWTPRNTKKQTCFCWTSNSEETSIKNEYLSFFLCSSCRSRVFFAIMSINS